jgi:hypothetical protein
MKIEGAKMEKGDGARGAGPAECRDACRNYRTVIPSHRLTRRKLGDLQSTREIVLYIITRIFEVDDL